MGLNFHIGYGGAIPMNLLKAFDTISCDLLTQFGLEFFEIPITDGWWLLGVPQGSALRTILFNIHVKNFFYTTEITDVYNYANNATFHTTFYLCD